MLPSAIWSSRRCEVKANDEQSPPLLSSNQTWLQGAMIANTSKSARIVSVAMSASAITPSIPIYPPGLIPIHPVLSLSTPSYPYLSTRSFRLLGCVSVARCAIARSQVPSAAGAEVLLGKMHPKDATSFGPKLHRSYAPPPWVY